MLTTLAAAAVAVSPNVACLLDLISETLAAESYCILPNDSDSLFRGFHYVFKTFNFFV